MQAMWLFGGEKGPQCWFDAAPVSTRIGLGALPGRDGLFPVIPFFYKEEDLLTIVTIAKVLQKLQQKPVVHVWNVNTPEPECVVKFEIQNPSQTLLEESGATSALNPIGQALGATGCKRLCAVSASDVDPESAREFMARFAEIGFIAISLAHVRDEDNSLFVPTMTLLTDTVRAYPFEPDFE